MCKYWIVISFIIALITGCNSTDISKNDVVVLGHAGAGFPSINNHYPINSEESIKQVLFVHGADGVEVDIQLTKDSQIVLYHDARLESGSNDTGFISALTWSELSKVQLRSSRTALYSGVHIWRLQDLFAFSDSLNLDIWLSLNIQNQYELMDQDSYNRLFYNALERLFVNYSGVTKIIVETPDHSCIVACKDLVQKYGVKLFMTGSTSHENIRLNGPYVSGFVTHYLDETETTIQTAKDAGFEIALYGVKIRQDIHRALKFKPDYVQTDNVPLTKSYLGR